MNNDVINLLRSYQNTEQLITKRLKELEPTRAYNFQLYNVYKQELIEVRSVICALKDYLKEVEK